VVTQNTRLESGGSTAPVGARVVEGLVVVGLGTITAPLGSSVNIAFPFIIHAFDVPLDII
jgi:hypothetical protein